MAENIPDNKPKTVRRPRLKLPFDNRKEDAGVWAYDHRIGLVRDHYSLSCADDRLRFVEDRRRPQAPHAGMFIDLRALAEVEKERDRLEQQVREPAQQVPTDWKAVSEPFPTKTP